MSANDLIIALSKNEQHVKKVLLEQHFELMSSMALRFAKNELQAKELLFESFNRIIYGYINLRNTNIPDFNVFLEKQFIIEAIDFIKSIRSEYYVASTVLAKNGLEKNYNLFENAEIIDYNTVDTPVLIKSLQELVPSQRLVFNLYVIDGFELSFISEILEASEQTVKSNLEKARFNLQKNIEKNHKQLKHEQAL